MYSSYGLLIGLRKELVIKRALSTNEAIKLLGVERNATKKEIKQAYLVKAKLYHPDNKVSFHASHHFRYSQIRPLGMS